ncbi:MAG: response regulator [Betaproteobacteria bacterium]
MLKTRYDAFAQRVLGSLCEVERRDVRAFDAWFYRGGGWRLIFVIVGVTTLFAWIASHLPWNMTFAEAAILSNVIVLMLVWSGLTAWFGYRKFAGRLFRVVVTGPLLALVGALIGAAVGGFIQGVDPVEWLQDSTKLRHVITAALIFGFLYTLFDAHRPQLAFLDIRMPGRSGLDVAAVIGGECHIVFITAYDQHAVQAFEAGAVDYLLKPVDADRLATAVRRVKEKLASKPQDLSALLAELRTKLNVGPTRLK